ncbi:hypothetical protein RND81_04G124000 [Saponaria officinalis]|uniref:BZIP domain-containing protein n=1 Tax=Saponaria officinalis TaxID=3572 RepID=A0AAW1LE45_SAPOF
MSSSTCCESYTPSLTEEFIAVGEVEAAEVLAGLGRVNMVDECGGDNSGWGSRGRRSGYKRVRDFDEVVDGGLSTVVGNSLPLPFDLNMEQPAYCEEECEKVDEPSVNVKLEEYEAVERSSVGVVRARQNANRSRHDLSEAEKEARKLRRILANRESARQTIRRRQALYEELKRRSVELASENEDLKRTKNLAVQEFQSLQTINHNLKDKISEIAGLQLGKTSQTRTQITNTDTHKLQSPKWQHYLPKSWLLPAYVQPPEVEIPQLPNQSGFPVTRETVDNSLRSSRQQIPCCILPCPCFQLASLKMTVKAEETLLDARHICSPSTVIHHLHYCSTSSSDARVCSLRNGLSLKREPCGYDLSGKKSDVVIAGAEARRRRREVIKLKSLHYDSVSRTRYENQSF